MRCATEKSKELFQRAANIKALVVDVDGVLTDGHIIHNDQGTQTKFFNSLDGFGIQLAKLAGLITGIISASNSPAIRHRAAQSGFDAVYIGSFDKLTGYRDFKKQYSLDDHQICYIGDDLPDLPVLYLVGLPVAVSNAANAVKLQVDFHTQKNGGQGAIREVIEFIMFAQGKYDEVLTKALSSFK